MPPTTRTNLAANIVSRAMANTTVGQRRRLLVELMRECAEGLAVVHGPAGAAEEAYRLADHLSARAA